jgi:hypothetical protein
MKLRQYLEELKEFAETFPECLDMDVVYSRDDEGNGYQRVHYGPNKGIFEDLDFIPADQLEDYEREEGDINAVCIN